MSHRFYAASLLKHLAVTFLIIVFFLLPGSSVAQPTVRSISITGNHHFSTGQLRDQFRTREGSSFQPAILSQDLSNITGKYHDDGYLSAQIEIDSIGWSRDSSTVDLAVRISEGRKAVLEEITVEGNTLLNADQILQMMETRTGSILHQPTLERDIELLVRRYERSGYPFAAVSIDRLEIIPDSTNGEEDRQRLVLTINEGPRVRIAEIRVAGNTETSEHVIVREAGIPLGELYNTDVMDRAVRRLRRMNLFSSVTEPELYTTDSGRGGVLLTVGEGSTNTFDGVLGYVPGSSSVGGQGYATGLVNVSMLNLFGTARKLALRWQKDDRYSQELAVRYNEPWVFELPIDLSGMFTQRQQDTTYVRRMTDLRATVRIIDALTAGGIATFEYVVPSATGGTFLASSRTITSGLELNFDTRDDILSATSGVLYHTDYRFGTKTSDATALLAASNSTVQRLGLDGEAYFQPFLRNIIALGLHARELTAGSIELADLYRFGGGATLRGYRENQFLGSRLAWSNVEYRLLMARRSFVFGFLDNGYYFVPGNQAAGITEGSAYKYGYGVGIRLETSLGNIGVSFALGQGDAFSQGKVHINLINSF